MKLQLLQEIDPQPLLVVADNDAITRGRWVDDEVCEQPEKHCTILMDLSACDKQHREGLHFKQVHLSQSLQGKIFVDTLNR